MYLSAYGWHQLNILSQIFLELSQGDQGVEGVVLVQDGAPNALLLDTDFQSKLGFSLVMKNSDNVPYNYRILLVNHVSVIA